MKLLPILLLLALPVVVQAQFTFTTNNGAITITGYTGSNSVVVIPDTTNGYPVAGIGDNAFAGNNNLTNITIPTSITSIGIAAFYGCINLAGITISDRVTNIGAGAFNSCLSLTSVVVPASVTNIGDYAFFYCTNLTAITVDAANPSYSSADGVLFNKDKTILMQFPFGKTGSYSIPGSVTSLADEAFGMNDHGQYPFPYSACAGLTNLFIPGSVTNIGDHAFSHCADLTSVTLGSGIASLGVEAFSWCGNLTSISIPNSVTSIGDVTFYYSGLINVTIPGSVTNIGVGAFGVCSSLNNVIIQDGVTSIGERAFNYCDSLTNVTIPNSVTSIGGWAFEYCTNLTGVYFQGNAPSLVSAVFAFDNNATVYYLPGTTGWENFAQLTGRPTVLWNPQVQPGDPIFGVQNNQFGFNITGSSNLVIVAEACTNLANPVWSPVQTNTLNTFIGTNGTSYFSDPQWTNYPGRFYRLRSP